MAMKGQFLGLDWNRIARLHSQVMKCTHMNSLTASRCHTKAYLDAANHPSKRVYYRNNMILNVLNVNTGFNSHLGIFSEFFSLYLHLISCCFYNFRILQ